MYFKIIKYLKKYGEVLTEYIADKNISEKGEDNLDSQYIYQRDVEWLKLSDVIIAEVSNPSLGVGYEIALAEILKKKIICLYNSNSEKQLSAMIEGNENIIILKYITVDDIRSNIKRYLS